MSIEDLRSIADATIDTDICLVGSGPAGWTIAEELCGSGLRVLMLESGGRTADPDVQALADTDDIGTPLFNGRNRILGGTSYTWNGRCVPFDDIDFEVRPWVPLSGWPFGPEVLAADVNRAADHLGAVPFFEAGPDDKAATIAAWHVAKSNGLLDVEFRVLRAQDGSHVWHHTRSAPIRDAAGHIIEWLGTATDIQALKEAQHRQVLILAELQHRTRNLLAVIQSMSNKTQRSSSTIEAFTVEFNGRLSALSRVQGLIAGNEQDTLALRRLIEIELAAYGDGDARKLSIEGPPIELAANTVQVLALALHELATNSVKYGAIGQPDGRLVVTWGLEHVGGRRCVALEWRESNVAMPAPGTLRRKGYGSELIEQALPYQLDAETELTFGPDGIYCRIVVPGGILGPTAMPKPHELHGRRVLVVEDDYMIASALTAKLRELNVTVFGPVGSVEQAMALIETRQHLDAAVLDINLRGQVVYPVADVLQARRVPCIFMTGYEVAALPSPYAGMPRCEKPLNMEVLQRLLLDQMSS